MIKTIVFSGFAGQGIINTGITLSHVAESMGKNSAFIPEYESEKGDTSVCTVVISDKKIRTFRTQNCDILVAMNKKAYDKNIDNVKERGIVLVNSNRVKAAKKKGIKIISVPVDDIVRELGNAKTVSTVLLSVLIGATDVISEDAYFTFYEEKYKENNPEIIDIITDAFEKGVVYGEQM